MTNTFPLYKDSDSDSGETGDIISIEIVDNGYLLNILSFDGESKEVYSTKPELLKRLGQLL